MTANNDIIAIHERAIVLPQPRSPISIRVATLDDLPFIDSLQKKHGKAVAFASTDELRGYIKDGMTLIAETCSPLPMGEGLGVRACPDAHGDRAHPHPGPLPKGEGVPIGYCLYRDRYMKREDCGIVSQLVVDSCKLRSLVGAALIQAMFERVPWGVRLFCCWCAQDLEANHFWEALGFVPLAFRAGSRGKEHGGRRKETRLHIFWERRVRRGTNGEPDEYPYWFPSQTHGGRMGEARLVLPIPPGTHWSDAKPSVLPGASPLPPGEGSGVRAFPDADVAGDRAHPHPGPLPEGEGVKRKRTPKPKRPRERKPQAPGAPVNPNSMSGGLWFAPPVPPTPPRREPTKEELKAQRAKERAARPRVKNDPKYVAAARELRDRYLEEVNAPGSRLLPGAQGKYDVSRQLAPGAAPYPGGELKLRPLLAEPGATGKLAA